MKKAISIFCLAVICVGLVWICGCGKSKEDGVTVLKLAHGMDTTYPAHKAMEFMAQKVTEKSGGKFRIDIYPSEQLGSERECIEQLQFGGLAMTKTSSSPMEGFIDEMKVLGMPYLFRDSEHCWKVLLGPIGKELLNAGSKVNLKGLCFYDAGARSFYAKKAINSPADLKGMKIRVQKSPIARKMVEAMGGSPTPIDWGELYTSLQQGVVDGAENNPPSFEISLHYEICKFYTLDEHTMPPDVLLISTIVWNKLSPEFQRILQEAADESVPYHRKLWAEKGAASMKNIEAAGVKIIRPDKKPFRESAKKMWVEFEGTKVGELIKRIEEVK